MGKHRFRDCYCNRCRQIYSLTNLCMPLKPVKRSSLGRFKYIIKYAYAFAINGNLTIVYTNMCLFSVYSCNTRNGRIIVI